MLKINKKRNPYKMNTFTKVLTISKRLNTCILRKYSKVVERELKVLPYCDIYINVCYSLFIKPLNVHKYPNCDKIIIPNEAKSLECSVEGNRVTITDNTKDTKTISVQIGVPVKANLYVTSKKDITVGQFNGDEINLKSDEGHVCVDKFNGKSLKICTNNGNIKLKDAINASNIEVVTENGSINAGKLQGLYLHLKTNKGDITVESSYCNESVFETGNGNLTLSNLHKHCQILVKEGHLNLVGFDGRLLTTVEKGNADIYLSRIMGNSEINIKNGALQLKLAELCQENIKFLLKSDSCEVEKVFKAVREEPGLVIISPESSEEHSVVVNCLNGALVVESVSWEDMMKMKLKK